MKKLSSILIAMCLTLLLASCAELISIEYRDVDVKVVDTYQRGMWLQPIRAGKVTTFITHPAVYQVTVEYNTVKYIINDPDTFNKYKDRVGQITTCTLEARVYDNGDTKYNITELK